MFGLSLIFPSSFGNIEDCKREVEGRKEGAEDGGSTKEEGRRIEVEDGSKLEEGGGTFENLA